MADAGLNAAEVVVARREIEVVLEPPAGDLVAAYFDPHGSFAGSTFDTIGRNELNVIGTDDLLAASFLDVAVKPRAVRAILFEDREAITELLGPIPTEVDLWDATDDQLDAAELLWDRLRSYPQIASVIAGKILARKRPRLVRSSIGGRRSRYRLPPDECGARCSTLWPTTCSGRGSRG